MMSTAGTHKYQWVIQSRHEQAADLAHALKISPILGQVLMNRGITSADQANSFLRPKLNELIRPERTPGVQAAVERIRDALNQGQKITVYGDYDVDGITGVSILMSLLKLLGGQVDYYIPHRLDEGYGLNAEAIESLAAGGTQLMITVDCGISGVDTARRAAELAMDVIITDHHLPGPSLPEAVAIVHPLLDPDYPNPHAAGAMVAFKLAWAVANAMSSGPRLSDELRQFMLDATGLAAVGTVADVVDLRGENRILTHFGLKGLAHSELLGVQPLIDVAGLEGQGVDSYDVGFKIGPMLNAAGRMGHARLAVELLTCRSEMRARQIAEYLKDQNTQRQQCGRKIFKEACQMVAARGFNHPDRRSIVLAGESWHRGVLGIVASRLVDKFYRPTIVVNLLDDDSGLLQGSARSIPGFALLEGIRHCSEHLVAFGGHAMAAGLTLESGKIEAFTEAFETYASEHLVQEDISAKLEVDALAPLSVFTLDSLKQLALMGPFGQGNPQPVFATQGVHLIAPPRAVGAKGDHLQLTISDHTGAVRCIGFGMGKLAKKLQEVETFNVAYEAQINHYNGNSSVQLCLTDIQFPDSPKTSSRSGIVEISSPVRQSRQTPSLL